MEQDQLITEYAAKLRRIYNNRTAGDFTFEGVLTDFARRWTEVRREDHS